MCSPNGSLPEDELAFMALNMDDDLDLSMRAPYISMNESDELPLLIAEDLMWGAQPEGLKDLKQAISLNLMKENANNNLNNNLNVSKNGTSSCNSRINNYQEQQQAVKNHMESSLAALLCSTLLQHQQQQHQQSLEKQISSSPNISSSLSFNNNHPTIINRNPDIKIKILDETGGGVLQNHLQNNSIDVMLKGFKNCKWRL